MREFDYYTPEEMRKEINEYDFRCNICIYLFPFILGAALFALIFGIGVSIFVVIVAFAVLLYGIRCKVNANSLYKESQESAKKIERHYDELAKKWVIVMRQHRYLKLCSARNLT